MPAAGTVRAQTEVDIANLALSVLGEPPIGTLGDNVARARVMAKWFGSARDATLRSYDWNFATAWIKPAMIAAQSIGPLVNRFPMPDDCVRVRFVADATQISAGTPVTDIEPLPNESWEIEAGGINPGDPAPAAKVMVTNVTTPLVCYTRRITQPALWDEEFVVAFSQQLAGYGATEILRDPTAAGKLADKADGVIEDIALDNAREAASQFITRSTTWVQSRRVGTVYRPPFRDTGW